jgi:SAM-dependent methyltransferase
VPSARPAPPPRPDLAAVDGLLRYEADIAFRQRAKTILEYLRPQPQDRVLDCGCGLGFHLRLLAELAPCRLYGFDISRPRLAEAAADGPLTQARLCIADVFHLPFADGAFDKLILSEVLEHLPQDASALAEAARVVRPGGVLAITVPHRRYPFLWDPINRTLEALGLAPIRREPWSGIWTGHRRLYEPRELAALIEVTGLRLADLRLQTRYCMPFSHNLVYGLGKFLVERSAAGSAGGRKASRYTFWGPQRRLTPVLLLIKLFTAFDRLNRPQYRDGPAVSLCAKAIKP